jgi:DNA-binding response OmpR family regulator
MALILVVEDNALIRDAVSECFTISGYEVTAVGDVAGATKALGSRRPDAIILDIRLPDGNGYQLAKDIRKSSDVPIIFLTAKESESERVMGFEVGADDYVVKPFSAKELVLRTGAILRRSAAGGGPTDTEGVWVHGDHELVLDEGSRRVSLDGRPVRMTESEWRILHELARLQGRAVTRDYILSECLDRPYDGSERTVDTHVANIRSLLGTAEWIETVRGYGYRFAGQPRGSTR